MRKEIEAKIRKEMEEQLRAKLGQPESNKDQMDAAAAGIKGG